MKVNEYFVSIQGEGPESGRRALFIRFSGCNLSCQWCDSKYALHTYLDVTLEDLLTLIYRSKCHYFVLTGGEPTLQINLSSLLDRLEHDHFQVDIETNGTYLPDKCRDGVRYIVSPKDFSVVHNWLAFEHNTSVHFVFKFVIDIDTMNETFDLVQKYCNAPAWFMPLTTNIKGKPDCMIDEMVTTGRIVQSEMIKRGIDGYLCTRLQNLYRVR